MRTGWMLLGLTVVVLAVLAACSGPAGPPAEPPAVTPTIVSFEAAPDRVGQDNLASVLTWEVSNATSVAITADVGVSPGTVTSSGSFGVTPSETTTYTLIATNDAGEVDADRTVTVEPFGTARLHRLQDNTLIPLSAVESNAAVDLVVSVYVRPPDGFDVESVRALRGGVELTEMFDDGDPTSGDELLGDGTYSGREVVFFTDAGAEVIDVEIVIGGVTYETSVTLQVVATSGGVDVQEILDTHAVAGTHLVGLDVGNDVDAAMAAVQDYLLDNQQAFGIENVIPEERSLTIVHTSGLSSMMLFLAEQDAADGDVRGAISTTLPTGASQASDIVATDPLQRVRDGPRVPLQDQTRGESLTDVGDASINDGALVPFQESEPDDNVVGSRSVLVWSPFAAEFAPWDETDDLVALFGGANLGFDVTVRTNTFATVDSLRDITDFGFVVFATHGVGGTWLVTQEEVVDPDRFEVEQQLGQIRVTTGYVLSDDGTVVRPPVYMVRDTWFSANLTGTFPNTIIVNNSCESTRTDRLWDAFSAFGAGAYFGYDKIVCSGFAVARVLELAGALVEGETTGEAFTPQQEAGCFNANWEMRGNEELRFVAGLINPSFEDGLVGWTVSGDGRSINRLGLAPLAQLPTDGLRMAVISTGLGFTISHGSIEQTFRMPSDATTLLFDWNYLSEEFLEFIGSGFQDPFTVSIVDRDGIETVLMYKEVDDVAADFGASFCSSPSQPCIEEGGDLIRGWDFDTGQRFVSFDRGDVWLTGWIEDAEFDVSTFAGELVTLRFYATDTGDTIYDTAVLVDNIRIE